MDAATEAWIAELVEQAPPLGPEQQALVVRIFGNRPESAARPKRKTSTKRPDAA